MYEKGIKLIEEAITEHYGERCAIKDTEEYPDMDEDVRCACCAAWEAFDAFMTSRPKPAPDNLVVLEREDQQ